ncbi:MAG: hypothetical protein HYY93_13500 [Planctomycetes bacterium]|nr:hypothetical protein [Planctomycetota bacterium]
MRSALTLALLLIARSAFADGFVIDHTCVDATDERIPREHLDEARSLDVLFGHQSVGGNILEGLEDLMNQDEERYAYEAPEDPKPHWFDKNDGFGHFEVGENEDPASKIDEFQSRLKEAGYGKHVSVAMFKFCFVDLTEGGEAKPGDVFKAYSEAMEGLEKEFPKVRFVWWTSPIETTGNRARMKFNRLVRDWCKKKGKVLFDLADIEANGGGALPAEDTDDGGHLNESGRVRVARAWWWLMARLAGWDGK